MRTLKEVFDLIQVGMTYGQIMFPGFSAQQFKVGHKAEPLIYIYTYLNGIWEDFAVVYILNSDEMRFLESKLLPPEPVCDRLPAHVLADLLEMFDDSEPRVNAASPAELWDAYLRYNGIIGYSVTLREVHKMIFGA